MIRRKVMLGVTWSELRSLISTRLKRIFKLWGIGAITLLISACSVPVEDVEIWIETNTYWGSLIVGVQAITDDVVIKEIIINRGNCTLPAGTQADLDGTVELSFGRSYRAYSHNCTVRDVVEVEIVTNNGRSLFEF